MSGSLVVVATPLGNLADLTPRALTVLTEADVVFCEDTRRTRTLLSACGVPAGGRLFALHEHNERQQLGEVVRRVQAGELVALVCDAGTPGISDPGAAVVAAVVAAGLTVTTTPGPSAVIGALSISGLSTDRFCMEGFVPRKAGERRALFDAWRDEPRTVVFFESPQRVAATLSEMVEVLGDRQVVVVRELTKMFEEVVRGSVRDVADQLAAREVKGELVVCLEGATLATAVDEEQVRDALRAALSRGASVRDAATEVAANYQLAHRQVYAWALLVRNEVQD